MGITTGETSTNNARGMPPRSNVEAGGPRTPHASSLVQWFLDYYWIRHPISNDALDGYRLELLALDHWLAVSRGRKLLSASDVDLRDYFGARYLAAGARGVGLPSLTCVRRFYFYLVEAGFRHDNPTEQLYVRAPRAGARAGARVVERAPS